MRSKSPAPEFVDYVFDDASRSITIIADLARGWRFLKKVYGFSGRVDSDWRGYRIRVQVQVWPTWGKVVERPPTLDEASSRKTVPAHDVLQTRQATAAELAANPDEEVIDVSFHVPERESPVRYTVSGSRLKVTATVFDTDGTFNEGLNWRQGASGKPTAHWKTEDLRETKTFRDKSSGQTWVESREYELQVLIIVTPPSMPVPIVREWQRRFFPGGLPTLGKHR